MLKFTVYLLCFLFALNSLCQKIEYDLNTYPIESMHNYQGLSNILVHKNKSYTAYWSKGAFSWGELKLISIDLESKEKKETVLNPKKDKVGKLVRFGNDIFAINKEDERKSIILTSRKVNNDLNLEDEKPFYEIVFEKKRNKPEVEIINESNYTCIFSNFEGKDSDPAIINVALFDSTKKRKWSKNDELPFTNEYKKVESFKITSEGHFMAVYSSRREGKEKEFYLIVYDDKGNKLHNDVIFRSEDYKWFEEVKINVNHENIVVSTFIEQKIKRDHKHSLFVAIFDAKNFELKTKREIELDTRLLYDYENSSEDIKNKEKGKDQELDNFYIVTDILFKRDNDIQVIAEYRENESFSSSNNQQSNYASIIQHFKGILVFNLSAEGLLLWSKKIPKYQKGAPTNMMTKADVWSTGINNNDLSISYDVFVKNNKTYFIFNDRKENLSIKKSEEPKIFEETRENQKIISIYELNNDGHVNKQVLSDQLTVDDCIHLVDKDISTNDRIVFFTTKRYKGGSKIIDLIIE